MFTRNILFVLFTGFLLVLAMIPTWNYNPQSEINQLQVQRNNNNKTDTQRSRATTQEHKPPIHIPEKINFISQVQQTTESLNHSPRIMTIHHNAKNKSHAMKQEVTVKFKDNLTAGEREKILSDIEGKIKKQWDHYCIFKSRTKSTEQLISYFKARQDVEFAEPNFLLLPNREPNDPLYTRYQWNLPLIQADRAWEITPGKANIIVAVIDTGVDLNHEDFKKKLVTGYNVLTGDNKPLDDNGHGTHVSGIISASTNNTVGIAGVSWNNKIMPIKAIGADGTGSSFDIAQGIKWAADHGAHVINMSVGNYHPSTMLHEAIRYAHNKGVTLVAASGNDNTNQPSYPAAYPEVISVAAVDDQSRRADFSNYGPYISVAAPGVDIPSTYIYNEYAALSGTSMACPHVAGLAGLILSVNSGLSNEEVRSIIEQSSTDLGTQGKDEEYGYGIINVAQALQLAEGKAGAGKTPPVKKDVEPNSVEQTFFERFDLRSFMELFR